MKLKLHFLCIFLFTSVTIFAHFTSTNELIANDELHNNLNNGIGTSKMIVSSGASSFVADLEANHSIKNNTGVIGAYEYSTATSCVVTIPDAALKADIISNGSSGGIDTNNDGEIQCSEATAYTGRLTLTGLIAGNWSDPTGLEAFTEITGLVFSSATTNLNNIDLTAHTKIESLNINGEGFTSIEISTLTSLADLRVVSLQQLTAINISNLVALREFNLSFTKVSSLDFSGLTNLEKITLRNNNSLPAFTLLNNNSLVAIDASNSSLNNMHLTNAPNLEVLSLGGNSNTIATLDLTQNTALTTLILGQNNLTTLDLTKNVSLEDLYISQNNLTTLDLSKNSNLEYITIEDTNSITDLDLSANGFLLEVVLNRNSGLTSLNIANANNGNSFTSSLYFVDVTNNANLSCIQHDLGFDPTTTNGNWTKDAAANWSTNCDALSFDTVHIDDLKIYPNPTSSVLHIRSNEAIETIEVYSVLGKKVMSKKETKTIDIRQLKRGVYFIQIITKNSKKMNYSFLKN